MAVQVSGRMPTGISSLDPVLDGGIPPGSVVLLEGDIGAGSQEFVYTSLIYLSMLRQRQDAGPGARIPDNLSYITFTRMREDILSEIGLSFAPNLVQNLNGTLSFTDLSTNYFDSSVVPSDWSLPPGERGASRREERGAGQDAHRALQPPRLREEEQYPQAPLRDPLHGDGGQGKERIGLQPRRHRLPHRPRHPVHGTRAVEGADRLPQGAPAGDEDLELHHLPPPHEGGPRPLPGEGDSRLR